MCIPWHEKENITSNVVEQFIYKMLIKSLIKPTQFKTGLNIIRQFQTSAPRREFYEPDRKGGYKDRRVPLTQLELIKNGFTDLKQEIVLWKKEMQELMDDDRLLINRPGETDIIYNFGTKDALNQWIVTCDSDHNEGYSNCSLDINKYGKGVFSGVLSTRVPKDGKIKRAGYCNMRTLPARKSFKRRAYLDWRDYNLLVMKVRGDGRSYLLNISTTGYFDIMWNDTYHFVLYTRGGPYWQVSKIPFSKFLFAAKGRVQDTQYAIPLNKITNFGISAGDKINGPFSLEIDYIGLEYDPNCKEEFAYEMYKTDKYIAQY